MVCHNASFLTICSKANSLRVAFLIRKVKQYKRTFKSQPENLGHDGHKMNNLDITADFQRAFDLLREGKKHTFITGRGGTGKSTLLEHYRSYAKEEPVVLAPTGVAALNVKGRTIHNFFNFYIDITPQKAKKIKPKNPKIYKNLKSLIIDEISMVRADLLDCMDVFLRRFGPDKSQAFGGVRMVFVGDLYQLPPVVGSKERELFSSYYESPFFFSAKIFKNFKMELVELKKIYRQRDMKFIELLNRIRDNSVSADDLELLNSRFQASFKPKKGKFYISLHVRNHEANQINESRLKGLKGRAFVSQAFIEGDFGKEYYPTSPLLKFKIGSQIMMLNNDSKRRWVNGSIGVIQSVEGDLTKDDDEAYLKARLYPENKIVEVYKYRWDIYKFSFSKEAQTIVSESVGAFMQFPFRLAWAVTVHKSQGKTFDQVIVDTRGGMPFSGQAYTAFSRCSSFEGLVLTSPVKKSSIKTDRRAQAFLASLQWRKSEEELSFEDKIKQIKRALEEKLLIKIHYLKPDNTESKRSVQPLFLGEMEYKGKSFQGLRAFCFKAQQERSFRVDRILYMRLSSSKVKKSIDPV